MASYYKTEERTIENVTLDSYEDWEIWDLMVRTRLTPRQWELIDPDQPTMHRARIRVGPRPKPQDYSQKYQTALLEYKTKKASYEDMISQASSTTTGAQTRARTTGEPVAPEATDISLSITIEEGPQYKMYLDDWKLENQEMEKLEAQLKACHDVVTSRLGFVATGIINSSMTSAEIYQAMATRFEPPLGAALIDAERQYNKAKKPPTKTGKSDLRMWLARWSSAVCAGIKAKYPVCLNAHTLVRDLLESLAGLLGPAEGMLRFDLDNVKRKDKTIPPTYIEIASAIEKDLFQDQDRHDVNATSSRRGAHAITGSGISQNSDDEEFVAQESGTQQDSRDNHRRGSGRGGTNRSRGNQGGTRGMRGRGGDARNNSSHGDRSDSHSRKERKCEACESTNYFTDRCIWLRSKD
jgi:hypothetical protein